ncbi:hypothetical protein PGUG_00349 [Meyerozyma guilliermondii ATCC 6260]|uniref:Uncharacterized protein n=1 Tax=Meyerozyma guilliermondii (strain ATCC 6260 / CBS 566 / DSM 6381 / JCM 1539 / NBRC 10279 / NRRL Y-324) TaxID=294746 RepID=A5DAP4_PICGU|nr:uncharacterized protein PGUG_00349 [Meyerozyma guilliermondii ATCC 6260]EDK36252.2 hypothetical protein PGUG_00349 [Meyerozyma guilliermondii ATCC 6260]
MGPWITFTSPYVSWSCSLPLPIAHWSYKVVGLRSLCRGVVLWGHRLKHLVMALEIVGDSKHQSDVSASITVVGCQPHRHQSTIKHLLVALHDKSVCSRYERHVVAVKKSSYFVVSKEKPSTAWQNRPPLYVLWVQPQEITHSPFVGHFLFSVNDTDLVHGVDIRTQTAVNTKHRPAHNGTKRQIIKHFAAVSPHIYTSILAHTLVVEPVHGGDLSAFMIASYQRNSIRISNF